MSKLIPKSTGAKIYVIILIVFTVYNTYTSASSSLKVSVGEYILLVIVNYVLFYIAPSALYEGLGSLFKRFGGSSKKKNSES
ncbi:hypothetical protein N9A50_04325 [Acidimicrobiaceae bacterium]|nr:hypothetical protein [Acidimicrobiaceae bacterium]